MKSEHLARIILFLLLVAAGFVGVLALGRPASASTILHARMPEDGGWSVETLRVQVGQPLHLRMTSDDVLHGFALGQSEEPSIDLLPGEWVETTLIFDQPGRYTFYCTRWCGRNHWRMRGIIEVDGAPKDEPPEKPLYLQLGIDLDAPHPASSVPAGLPSSQRGEALAWQTDLPAYVLDRRTYETTAPAALFDRLRAEPALKAQPDQALWDLVAYAWARQTSTEALAKAKQLYADNCAACHGETGKGDGVMVEGLPRFDPGHVQQPGAHDRTPQPGEMAGEMGLSAPPDFTDPRGVLGASPALLEGKMIRGGMGTGMPYWGPIFTEEEMDALVAYIYTFVLTP